MFWGTGRGVVDFDKNPTKMKCSYYEKIRIDKTVFLELENTHTYHISSDCHTKEDGSKEELLLLQDNMDDQVQKKYQDMCQ